MVHIVHIVHMHTSDKLLLSDNIFSVSRVNLFIVDEFAVLEFAPCMNVPCV